jgi:hypothetical protein
VYFSQKLVKLINTFFNNPAFWNHVCIVFTKSYSGRGCIDKATKTQQYRGLVLNLIRECQSQSQSQSQPFESPQLPVFFVDSIEYDGDAETKQQYAKFQEFVSKLPALQTEKVVVPNVEYLKVEKERRANILVNTRIEGDTRIQSYEHQEREKRTGYDGVTITYSDWTATLQWEARRTQTSRTERKTECAYQSRSPIYRWEEGKRRYGVAGPRPRWQVQCGETVTRTMRELVRVVRKDFEGVESFGAWGIAREWTVSQ